MNPKGPSSAPTILKNFRSKRVGQTLDQAAKRCLRSKNFPSGAALCFSPASSMTTTFLLLRGIGASMHVTRTSRLVILDRVLLLIVQKQRAVPQPVMGQRLWVGIGSLHAGSRKV